MNTIQESQLSAQAVDERLLKQVYCEINKSINILLYNRLQKKRRRFSIQLIIDMNMTKKYVTQMSIVFHSLTLTLTLFFLSEQVCLVYIHSNPYVRVHTSLVFHKWHYTASLNKQSLLKRVVFLLTCPSAMTLSAIINIQNKKEK